MNHLQRPQQRAAPIGATGLVCVLCLTACVTPESPPVEPTAVAVTSEVVARKPFRAAIDLLGEVEAHSLTPITAPIAGELELAARFRNGFETGASVRRGEVLATISNLDLRLEVDRATLEVSTKDAELERTQAGVDAGVVRDVDLERARDEAKIAHAQLEAARARLERRIVRSPRTGWLRVAETIHSATEVSAGQVLASVAEGGPQRIVAWASASDLPRLRSALDDPSTVVEARLPGRIEPIASGRLVEVARDLDQHGAARIGAVALESYLLPPAGQGLEVRVLIGEAEDSLTVPEDALVKRSGISSVWVLETTGDHFRANHRIVTLGGQNDGTWQVVDGLAEGERIAVRGVELLSDGGLAIRDDRRRTASGRWVSSDDSPPESARTGQDESEPGDQEQETADP